MIKIGNTSYATINEYAKLKGVTIQTVYNWIKEKKVKTRKLMNTIVIEL